MGALLTNLSFLQPLILMALISLPLLWILLRVTPPPPKVITLPTFHFLKDLTPQDHAAKDTPLWLLLLRLLAAALIIIGFAGPVLNAQSYLKGSLPARIIVDNSWAGAANWDDIITKASHILEEAARDQRDVQLSVLAADSATQNFTNQTMSAKDALSRLKAMDPQGWNADPALLMETIEDQDNHHSYLLSSGLGFEGFKDMADMLVRKGGLDVFLPQDSALPYILQLVDPDDTIVINSDEDIQGGIQARLKAFDTAQTNRPLRVHALDSGNAVIETQNVQPADWEKAGDGMSYYSDVSFNLPPELVAKIQRLQLRDQKTAGSTLIVDPSRARKDVGIVQVKGEKDQKAYIGASFYLQRALSPYADITQGSLQEILDQSPAVIILPDDVAVFTEQLNAMQAWLEKGGILIRFAGLRLLESDQRAIGMDQSLQRFLPVTLRRGGRSMGGELSWESALPLKEFAENSLFYGLPLSEDVKIKQMVLPEPGEYLEQRSWASLSDGTPLVTYEARENGLIVLFHTAATPDWSSLPLSGLYVSMLKRIIDLSALPRAALSDLSQRGSAQLAPVYILGGYGQVIPPRPAIKPISVRLNEADAVLSANMPAGLYAGQGLTKTLNLSATKIEAMPVTSDILPFAAETLSYQSSKEQRPGSFILFLALLILFLDVLACFVLMGMSSKRFKATRKTVSSVFMMIGFMGLFYTALFANTPSAMAQNNNNDMVYTDDMMEYANNFFLAYIKTGDASIDDISQIGLEELALALNMRTSAEPTGIKGIDLEQDELSFFPVIYWPVIAGQNVLNPDTMAKIQNYIDHGGMILFDLQDDRSLEVGRTSTDLQSLIGPLNIAPLEIVPKEHALRRSFYLLDEFPGDIPDNPLWVETRVDTRIADAGSILIGSNQWAQAWARSSGTQRDEMATRFGINLVMYALTGNYKTDQVHVKHILERLGE